MKSDFRSPKEDTVLRVDGGMAVSDWTMQYLSNIIQAPVDRPNFIEPTALGVAWLAGMHVGFYPSMDEFSCTWSNDKRFIPKMDSLVRRKLIKGWELAINRTLLK